MENLVYHIDNTFVTLGKICLEGWAISKDGKEVGYKLSRNSTVEKTMRSDVNKCHDFVGEKCMSGFNIKIKSWRNEKVMIYNESDEININIDCFKLKKIYVIATFKKVIKKIKEVGFFNAVKLIKKKLRGRKTEATTEEYMLWREKHMASKQELEQQKKISFKYSPLISIVVPTYNTPINFLSEMITSVMEQTYSNWELCIADGASSNEGTVRMLKKYEKKSSKIKIKYLEENKMISNNTNEAISIASGEYIGLFDHDDLLAPNALFEIVSLLNENKYDMIYTDEDKTNSEGSLYFEPHFKPDFSKYTLRSYNYITHFTVINKLLLDEIGRFDSACDGAQDFDMFLRVSDKSKNIGHIPKVLYHWRVHDQSTAASASAKTYVTDAGKLALRKHLERCEVNATVKDGMFPTSYKSDYSIDKDPLVSIIIPNKDHIDDLGKCLKSIADKTIYENYEIIVVENNSEETQTFDFYEKIQKNKRINVCKWENEFNFSAINNYGVNFAKGEFVLLLNNDVEIINGEWLTEMLMFANQPDVGVVGAKLYYDDNTIQHAGIILGIGGVAGHSHKYYARDSFGYVGRLKVVQDLSAVTAACLLIRKTIYDEVNGLDEGYRVAFNDVDFCMRIKEKGYHNLFTPYAELYHYESKSRGLEDTEEKIKRFNQEINRFEKKWGLWNEDTYYNCNLSNTKEDFSLR